MRKYTFTILGWNFTVSVAEIKSVWSQVAHFGIHFLISLWNPAYSAVIALSFEFRDGEQGHLEPWKEGFNAFPDLFFRSLGVLGGYYIRGEYL